MTERLWARWRETVEAARRGAPDEVCERAGWAIVLHVLDLLPEASAQERQDLRAAIAAALPECDPDLRPVAAAALGVLGHDAPGALPADLRRPTARRLSRLLRAELDPVAAAHCAGWLLRHPPEADLARAMAHAEGAVLPRRISVAAASAGRLRDPSEGRVVATLDDPRAEAVWFAPERALAVYTADAAPVHLEAEGVTTREIAPGYWIGEVAQGVAAVDAELHVGERSLRWTIPLTSATG